MQNFLNIPSEIRDSGQYLIGNDSPSDVVIRCAGVVTILDLSSDTMERVIDVQGAAEVHIYGCVGGGREYTLNATVHGEGGSCISRYIVSCAEAKAKFHLEATSAAIGAKVDTHIVSLIGEKSVIDLDGVINIAPNIHTASGHILEENVFLGDTGTLRGIPSLNVHSNDVQAGHAARIERISPEKLYYLSSRGISSDDATSMLLRGMVSNCLGGLSDDGQQAIWGCIAGSNPLLAGFADS